MRLFCETDVPQQKMIGRGLMRHTYGLIHVLHCVCSSSKIEIRQKEVSVGSLSLKARDYVSSYLVLGYC